MLSYKKSQLECQRSKLSSQAIPAEHLFSRTLLLLRNFSFIRLTEHNVHFKNVGTDIETIDFMAYQRYYNLAGK